MFGDGGELLAVLAGNILESDPVRGELDGFIGSRFRGAGALVVWTSRHGRARLSPTPTMAMRRRGCRPGPVLR